MSWVLGVIPAEAGIHSQGLSSALIANSE